MNGELYLNGAGFAAAKELFENDLTRIRDALFRIDEKGRELSHAWEGEAEKTWFLILEDDLSEAFCALAELQNFSNKLIRAAGKLSDTKRKAALLVEGFAADLI